MCAACGHSLLARLSIISGQGRRYKCIRRIARQPGGSLIILRSDIFRMVEFAGVTFDDVRFNCFGKNSPRLEQYCSIIMHWIWLGMDEIWKHGISWLVRKNCILTKGELALN